MSCVLLRVSIFHVWLSTLSGGLWFPATTDQAFSKHTLLSPIPPVVPHTVKGTIIQAPICPSVPHTCGVFFPSLITAHPQLSVSHSSVAEVHLHLEFPQDGLHGDSTGWNGQNCVGDPWTWRMAQLSVKPCLTLSFLTSLAGVQCPLYYRLGKSQVLLVWLSVGDSSGSCDIEERDVLTAGRAPSWQEVFFSCFLSPPVADNHLDPPAWFLRPFTLRRFYTHQSCYGQPLCIIFESAFSDF